MEKSNITLDKAKKLGKKIGIDFNTIRLQEFKKGLKVELEHADVTKKDPIKTAKIALAHLKELPDYYTRLAKMERNGKKKSNKRKK